MGCSIGPVQVLVHDLPLLRCVISGRLLPVSDLPGGFVKVKFTDCDSARRPVGQAVEASPVALLSFLLPLQLSVLQRGSPHPVFKEFTGGLGGGWGTFRIRSQELVLVTLDRFL